jgi:citrate lyase beta subunit
LLFTPGSKSDCFARAAAVHADALIIDLEDAVSPPAKKEAREASLRYLEGPSINLPCLVRINARDTRVGLDDLQAILNSSAEPDCLILPKCDSPYFDIADVNGLKRETKASALLGFHGKCAIHPAQIAIINEVLTPTEEKVAKARQILVVNQQGVGSVDGKMVDEAIAPKARLILARAGIAVRDQTCSPSTGIKSN